MARRTNKNIFGTFKKSVNNTFKILIILMVIALFLTISNVAKFVGKEIIPAVNGGKIIQKEVIQSVAIDSLLIMVGVFLCLLAVKVIVPVLAVGLAIVGLGMIFYYGKDLIDTLFKKKSSGEIKL